MRIAFLAKGGLPSRWANGVQVARCCEAFGRLGHEVVLYTRHGDAPVETSFDYYGVERLFSIVPVRERFKPFHQLIFNHLDIVRDFRARGGADLVYARSGPWLRYLAPTGTPLVYEAHAPYPRGGRQWRELERSFRAPNFARLVCVTSTLAEAYAELHPALAGKDVIVAPSSASPLPDIAPLPDWPGRPGALQVGLATTPFPGKGIELLAEAAGALPDVDFHVVGAARADLGWIEAPPPANLILHGHQPYARMAAYFRRFDVAVAPYGRQVYNKGRRESGRTTSPSKIAEYFAAGLPVVTADIPGVRDMLGPGETALLVPPGDVPALIGALRRMRDEPGLRARLAATAARHFEETLTATARARRVLAGLDLRRR